MNYDFALKAMPLDRVRQLRLHEVRAECRRRITAAGWPEFRQLNAQSEFIATGDNTEVLASRLVIEPLRAKSNALEAWVATADREALLALNVRDAAHWIDS